SGYEQHKSEQFHFQFLNQADGLGDMRLPAARIRNSRPRITMPNPTQLILKSVSPLNSSTWLTMIGPATCPMRSSRRYSDVAELLPSASAACVPPMWVTIGA